MGARNRWVFYSPGPLTPSQIAAFEDRPERLLTREFSRTLRYLCHLMEQSPGEEEAIAAEASQTFDFWVKEHAKYFRGRRA